MVAVTKNANYLDLIIQITRMDQKSHKFHK